MIDGSPIVSDNWRSATESRRGDPCGYRNCDGLRKRRWHSETTLVADLPQRKLLPLQSVQPSRDYRRRGSMGKTEDD